VIRLVKLIEAPTPTEALKVKILLGRANIPYTTTNELNFLATAQGPIRFHVPAHLLEVALAQLEDSFEVKLDDLPEYCPACHAKTIPSKPDCPGCGLFLG
jgi:hypothetical protein